MITVVLLVEIRSAANVLMRDGRTSRGLDRRHAIETVLEDGRHALEAGAADRERAGARDVDALAAVPIPKADQAEACAVPRLGMRAAAHDRGGDFAHTWPDARGPCHDPLRRPTAVIAVRPGPVLVGNHAGPLRSEAARVRRDTHALVKDLDDAHGRADLDRLTDERVRHAVDTMLEGDAVVDVDLRAAPLGDLVTTRWKRTHRRPIDRVEDRASTSVELLKGSRVESLEQLADRLVELCEAEEGAITQRCQDPALRDEHPDLHLRLVARPSRAGRDDSDAVVLGHLEVGRIDVRLVPIRPADRAAELVGDDDLRHRAEVLEGADRRPDEVGELLRARRLREGVVARAEDRDEELDLGDLAGLPIDDSRLLAGVVDEDLLAGAMHLPHHDAERLPPSRVQVAEAAVLVRSQRRLTRGRVPVLDPECLQRHARSCQLATHPREVDRHACRRLVAADVAKHPRLELHVPELARGLPFKPDATSARQVVADRRLADPNGRGDLRVASPALVLQPQNLSYLPHRQSLRHRARVRDEVATARAAR